MSAGLRQQKLVWRTREGRQWEHRELEDILLQEREREAEERTEKTAQLVLEILRRRAPQQQEKLTPGLEEKLQPLKTGLQSDYTIVCQGVEFAVHRNTICPKSPFFAKACNGDWREAHNNRLDMSEEDPDTVRKVIYFLYANEYCPDLGTDWATDDKLPASFENDLRVYKCADLLMIDPLKHIVGKRMVSVLLAGPGARKNQVANALRKVFGSPSFDDEPSRQARIKKRFDPYVKDDDDMAILDDLCCETVLWTMAEDYSLFLQENLSFKRVLESATYCFEKLLSRDFAEDGMTRPHHTLLDRHDWIDRHVGCSCGEIKWLRSRAKPDGTMSFEVKCSRHRDGPFANPDGCFSISSESDGECAALNESYAPAGEKQQILLAFS